MTVHTEHRRTGDNPRQRPRKCAEPRCPFYVLDVDRCPSHQLERLPSRADLERRPS